MLLGGLDGTGAAALWTGSRRSAASKVSGFTEPGPFFCYCCCCFSLMPKIRNDVWEAGRLGAARSPSHASLQLAVFWKRSAGSRHVEMSAGDDFSVRSPAAAPTPSVFHKFCVGGGGEVCGHSMMLTQTEVKMRDLRKAQNISELHIWAANSLIDCTLTFNLNLYSQCHKAALNKSPDLEPSPVSLETNTATAALFLLVRLALVQITAY